MDERNARVASLLGPLGADWAVLSGVDSVCYATGHAAPLAAGPSPFAGGPTLAIVGRDGQAALVTEAGELDPAAPPRAGLVCDYDGFSCDPAGPPIERRYLDAAAKALDRLGVGGTIAIEPATHPDAIGALLEGRISRTVDVTPALRVTRATKTRDEIERLRECARLTGIGQQAAREALAVGRTELEVFAAVRSALDAAERQQVVLGADLLSGIERTAAVMGPPGPRALEPGDPVLCDLVPRAHGYWGDSCQTWTIGPPARAFARMYDAARAALERAAETLRPGIVAGDFADGVYATIEAAGYRDPIHAGHGIGTANVEFPRLVRRSDTVLEAGMVLMVEPGAYQAGVGGVRLEWMFLVTPTGNEVMSPYAIADDPMAG